MWRGRRGDKLSLEGITQPGGAYEHHDGPGERDRARHAVSGDELRARRLGVEDGVQPWGGATAAASDGGGGRPGGGEEGDRGGEGAVQASGRRAGGELLRGGAGWVLAAPRAGAARSGEQGGGLGLDRGEPPSQAGEDGPAGRGAAAEPAAPVSGG